MYPAPAIGMPARGPVPMDKPIFQDMFAEFFTLILCCVFAYPFIISLYMAADTHVSFWFGGYMYVAFLVPFMILLQYAVHRRFGKPRRSVIYTSSIMPCLVFMILGTALLFQSNTMIDKLTSTDCDTYAGIRDLQMSWQDARSAHACCMRSMWDKPSPIDQHCVDGTRPCSRNCMNDAIALKSCPGYEEDLEFSNSGSNWGYLEHLERGYACTGFCYGSPVSTFSKEMIPRDGCAHSVATVLQNKVSVYAMQLLIFNLSVCFVIMVWIMLLSPTVKNYEAMVSTMPPTAQTPLNYQ